MKCFQDLPENFQFNLYCDQIPKLVDLVGKLDKLASGMDFIRSHQFETYFNSYWQF